MLIYKRKKMCSVCGLLSSMAVSNLSADSRLGELFFKITKKIQRGIVLFSNHSSSQSEHVTESFQRKLKVSSELNCESHTGVG